MCAASHEDDVANPGSLRSFRADCKKHGKGDSLWVTKFGKMYQPREIPWAENNWSLRSIWGSIGNLYTCLPLGICIWSMFFQSRVGLERMNDKHNNSCYH